MELDDIPTIDAKKFLLERRLIEIRKFIREANAMIADSPDLNWKRQLRSWISEHREEKARVQAELKAHLGAKR
jgi:hypothetical protein